MTPERARELACDIIHDGESCASFRAKEGSQVCACVAALLLRGTAASACQHEGHGGDLDCSRPAVLCVDHGGHDACAVQQMQDEALLREVDNILPVKGFPGDAIAIVFPETTYNKIRARFRDKERLGLDNS